MEKNKYQDALFTLVTNSSQFLKENKLEGSQFMEWHNKSKDLLQELVDKLTPMKPVRKGKLNWWHCPKCDCSLMFDNHKYCDHCGQKLGSDECE